MRIAVVGSGISGLAAAWLLARRHEVHVLERDDRVGGHTHTVTLDPDGGPARSSAANRLEGPAADAGRTHVDTGFIVYNEPTYPLLSALLDELGVETQTSDMSWSLRCDRHGLEYAGSPRGVLAQPGNLASPAYLRFLADIGRFHRIGRRLLDEPRASSVTLGRFLAHADLGEDLARHYLLPMAAAIWSTPIHGVADLPLRVLLRFFHNHGLLGITTHHPWRTVAGGASAYVPRLLAPVAGVRTAQRLAGVARDADGVELRHADGTRERVDAVVVATHADEALALLSDPDPLEKELLGAWEYTSNDAWLHTDEALLPRRRAARASWNYLLRDCEQPGERVALTYDMNRLQSLPGPTQRLVTLNPAPAPAPGTVRYRTTYTHPGYTPGSVATHDRLDELNGRRRTFFVGAYQRYGFHEDGLWSAVRAVRHLGVRWPS